MRAVQTAIQFHPYFQKCTKTGKPFKRRDNILKDLLKLGITSYMAVENEKEDKSWPQ